MSYIILIVLAALLITIPLAGKTAQKRRMKDGVQNLFEQAGSLTKNTFSYDQLEGLPQPVQRYFRHVLQEGQPYISYVRLKHDGWFKTGKDKKAMDIQGEQYFTAEKPGFIWKGKTSMFTARDMYLDGKGSLTVHLFSLIRIVREEGPNVDQGELLRWLGESVWFPTNLLPNKHLQWLPINDHQARLNFKYKDLSVYYIVTFNEDDEIEKMETERYMGNEGLTPWVGRVSEYHEVEGVKVPSVIEASWMLEDGKYTYGRFRVQQMEYDKPTPY
jgi:hypothetical protein